MDEIPQLSSESKWFAVRTSPRHEKRVAEHFCVREVEHFLPLYEKRRQWKDGSKVVLELPLFPGYLFVRIVRSRRVRVLEVPGVLAIVGSRREASSIPDEYMQSLRECISLNKMEPHSCLVIGARVRIIRGVMAGTEGVLLKRKNESRVVLTMGLIMKSMAVEVDASDLESIFSTAV